ncbi:protein of unknown function [Paraburkholderia dioscoreae]|uniref:Uncharacterized protein n=1 Tax=Paraburkholderia dioscoreae TaxID=2604047 RepID=A0A5Q4YTN3_9BURK|nr:protein of unknown function [Paraburkholderia dioscoreae]
MCLRVALRSTYTVIVSCLVLPTRKPYLPQRAPNTAVADNRSEALSNEKQLMYIKKNVQSFFCY